MNNTNPIRYFLYARKSSESDDRQMASIDDQINVMTKFAKERGIIIHDIIQESKSAKKPGRAGFAELTQRILAGEASGILTWKLNRLARNPVDGGQISWLLQQGHVKHIQTHFGDHKPTDNVLMMQLEFGMANQYVKDLSVDVKRGMLAKAKRGWFPSSKLPVGYKHNTGFRIDVDPEIIPQEPQFSIVKSLWKKLLKGNHSIASLYEEAKLHKLSPWKGRVMSRGAFYRIFTNPFYYGAFEWKDQNGSSIMIEAKHKPMISYREFQKTQDIMRINAPTPLNVSYLFPYIGLLRCGECDCAITAEQKRQAICTGCKKKFSIKSTDVCPGCGLDIKAMKAPKLLSYTYYRCSKSKGSCSQKYVRDAALEEQILSLARSIALPTSIITFFRTLIAEEDGQGYSPEDSTMVKNIQQEIEVLEKRRQRFVEMRADEEISREEFQANVQKISSRLSQLQASLEQFTQANEDWKQEFNDTLNLIKTALRVLEEGTVDEKITLLKGFASNLIIRDKTLLKPRDSLLLALLSMVEEAPVLSPYLEPMKTAQQSRYSPEIPLSLEACHFLRGVSDKLRTLMYKNKVAEKGKDTNFI